jgi:hypothetical protein
MSDVFDKEGDSVENPIHENTPGSDPKGEGGRALTASPVEQTAAALLAAVGDLSFWRASPPVQGWLCNDIVPKGDTGMAEYTGHLIAGYRSRDRAPEVRISGAYSTLESASLEFKAELKQQLLGAGRLKAHVHALYESLTGTTVEEFLKTKAWWASWPGELTRTLTDEEVGKLRRELLLLMAPFPSTRDKMKDNTLAALTLLRELPDSEVRKITNGDGGSFIKVLDAALVAEQAGPGGGQKQPVGGGLRLLRYLLEGASGGTDLAGRRKAHMGRN